MCLPIAMLALRGRLLALVSVGLLFVSTAAFATFVFLPEFGVQLLPRSEMVARAGQGRVKLIALQVRRGRTPHIALCEEMPLLPGVRWTHLLQRVGPTDGVEILPIGRGRFRCSFPCYRGNTPRPRIVHLRRG